MANPEHLELLKQGADAWNTWWHETNKARTPRQPMRVPDLSAASLIDLDFTNFDLSGARFRRAKLRGSKFEYTNLRYSDFGSAKVFDCSFFNSSAKRASFKGAELSDAKFRYLDLRQATFARTYGTGTTFEHCDLVRAVFDNCRLAEASFYYCNLALGSLKRAGLAGSVFFMSHLSGDLTNIDLRGSDLGLSSITSASLRNADLSDSNVYGLSVWDVTVDGAIQKGLRISRRSDGDDGRMTVDDIRLAQLIYLLINNPTIRDVISVIGRKAVLVLGRFDSHGAKVIDVVRNGLQQAGYLPIVFDFDKPSNRNLTETVSILAHLCRFIVVDLTSARSVPHELRHLVPVLPSVPVQPIILSTDAEYGMVEDLKAYPWFLTLHRYSDVSTLDKDLRQNVLEPAEAYLSRTQR